MGGDHRLQALHGLVRPADRVELERDLDFGALAHRRRSWHQLIGADRRFALLHVLEQIGDGDRREIVIGAQNQGEAQIDQRGQFVALPRAGAAQPIEHLGRALLRVVHRRRQRLAGHDIGERGLDHGMIGNQAKKILINLLRALHVVVA